jgi:hypothetical protein
MLLGRSVKCHQVNASRQGTEALDGFTGLFYQSAWPIIEGDIMQAFHSLWVLDSWSFYLINQAYMILLLQGEREATKVKDFRPISLIHSLSKLIAKVL